MKKTMIGFTGTRNGMTPAQKQKVRELLKTMYDPSEAHHGDCTGSDEDFHEIVRRFLPLTMIVIHPPSNYKLRAFCFGDVILPEKDYTERDDDVIKASDVMLATPGEVVEQLRSGTWTTIRHAVNFGKPVTIVYPDGSTETRRGAMF